ncbi:TupA-like ATPgrasp [Granulicatella balaenopterae]|uniref:TupA-like ATPgrasp n=1 Tax=Granulicatella balaenopterae TaxID=137733 RepID=A0A1H9KA53_9LACT|nr:ATP-grasp fold amidoligase family protein [Granulicatella balaenopterae]SEQ96011.1 TupA-like ATPgrasp [Granulicatella balaenopterae]
MKNNLKKICRVLKIESDAKLIFLKNREWRFKLLYNSDSKKEDYIKKFFKKSLGYEIDFNKEPETFNQKVQFRKLYDNNPLYAVCADKYRVREYVKEKIGEEYLIPLHLVTDKLTIEQWNQLPNSFVAKANHNSGPVQIVKDKRKANAKEIIKELNNQLKIDYGIISMEKYYSDIPRKIIVEEFLEGEATEYKFHCFNTDKIVLEKITKASVMSNMYDPYTWEKFNFTTGNEIDQNDYEKPENYEKMIDIAKELSKDFEYARIDLYNIQGKIYVGEITFCENSGFGKITDEKWDYKLGHYWQQKIMK